MDPLWLEKEEDNEDNDLIDSWFWRAKKSMAWKMFGESAILLEEEEDTTDYRTIEIFAPLEGIWRWGCKALPLSRWMCSRWGDHGLPGPLLRHPVPALLLFPNATTHCGPPRQGVGPTRIVTILHLHNGSSILGPSNSRRGGGGHNGQRSRSAGGNRRRNGGIPYNWTWAWDYACGKEGDCPTYHLGC